MGGDSRYLKVIACIPTESDITVRAAEDVLQLPKVHNTLRERIEIELLHARDPLGAMAIASKAAVLSTRSARAALPPNVDTANIVQESTTVVLAHKAPRYLMLPTSPSRSVIESIFLEVTQPLSGVIVTLGLFAFPSGGLNNPLPLSVPIASSIGLLKPDDLARAATSHAVLESFLPSGGLRMARPRYHERTFVEVRGLVEYDAIIDALFDSASFQRIAGFSSVQVVIKRVKVNRGSAERDVYRPLSLDSLWLLCNAHVAEFIDTRTTHHPPVVAQSTRHYDLPDGMRCTAPTIACIVVASFSLRELLDMSTWVHNLILGTSAASDRYYPPSRSQSHAQDPADAWLSTNRTRSVRPDTNSTMMVDSHVAADGALRSEIERLGKKYDAAEQVFHKALSTRNAQLLRLKADQQALADLQETLATKRSDKDALDAERKESALSLTTVREDVTSLQRSVDELTGRLQGDAKKQDDADNNLEQQRSELIREHERHVATVVQGLGAEEERAKDRQRVEGKASSEEHKREMSKLTTELAGKRNECKQKEEAFNNAAIANTTSDTALGIAQERLREENRNKESLLQQLRAITSLEHYTLATSGGNLGSILETQQQQIRTEEENAHTLDMQVASATARLDELKAQVTSQTAQNQQLSDTLRSSVVSTQRQLNSYHTAAITCWSSMRHSLTLMESDHRDALEAAAVVARSLWSEEEQSHWMRALHAAEARFVEESQQRCHEDALGVTSRLKDIGRIRDEAERKRDVSRDRLQAAKKQHDDVRDDMVRHLESIRDEEHNLLMFIEGKPMPPTAVAFPSLMEDENQIRAAMEQLRVALATGAVVRTENGGGADLRKKLRGAFASQLSMSQHITAADMMRRLEELILAGKEATNAAQSTLQVALSRLHTVEAELEGRKDILKRIVDQTTAADKILTDVHSQSASASEEILRRKEAHEALRQQLQVDYIAARDIAKRHQAEGQTHLRQLEAQEASLLDRLRTSNVRLRELEVRRTKLELQNPTTSLEQLHLRIQRERERQAELQQIVDVEESLMARAREKNDSVMLSIQRDDPTVLSSSHLGLRPSTPQPPMTPVDRNNMALRMMSPSC